MPPARLLCLLCALGLILPGRAARAADPAEADVRLRTPIKVVKPRSGPGGINVETERWGFINPAGELVIPPRWDEVGEFHAGLARAKRGGKSGYIDLQGKVVVPLVYDNWSDSDQAGQFHDGLAAIQKGNRWGFVDPTGKEVITVEWEGVSDFSEGLAAVKRHGKWGFIGTNGKVVIGLRWDEADSFDNGRAAVRLQKKERHIDRQGRLVDRPPRRGTDHTPEEVKTMLHADNVGDFHEGLATVRLKYEGLTGFVNPRGEMVIPPQWHLAWDFSEGLAVVQYEQLLWGLIDKTGQPVFELRAGLSSLSDNGFKNGLCEYAVMDGEHYANGIMDRTGKTVIPPERHWWSFEIKQGYILASGVVERARGRSYAWYDRTGRKIWQSGPQPTPPAADPVNAR